MRTLSSNLTNAMQAGTRSPSVRIVIVVDETNFALDEHYSNHALGLNIPANMDVPNPELQAGVDITSPMSTVVTVPSPVVAEAVELVSLVHTLPSPTPAEALELVSLVHTVPSPRLADYFDYKDLDWSTMSILFPRRHTPVGEVIGAELD